MLTTIEKILFILLALGSFYYGGVKFYSVYRAIARGKPDERFDNLAGTHPAGDLDRADAAIGF